MWQAANRARSGGVDVRAVTSWALLGSHDWNSLVTRETDYYEPGAFDVRGPVPRATALASMVHALATERRFEHPVLATPGWWHRGRSSSLAAVSDALARPILIVDDAAQHGRALGTVCAVRGLAHVVIDRDDIDIESASELDRTLDAHRPWAVIDATGNGDLLSDACERRALPFISYSPHAPDAGALLDTLLDDSCRMVEDPEQSTAIA